VAAHSIMSSLKNLKLAQKAAIQQQEVVHELNGLVDDIERCEKTIVALKAELEGVNERHKDRKTTREDIAYLTDLLKCANKKLTWEKHIASLRKRTPATLQRMSQMINDPKNPPSDELRAAMVKSLQGIQQAMERLQAVKVE
jgi:predicted RNase H-like nuclease (RuvC/YqgF family)